jgi:hypothetical protein
MKAGNLPVERIAVGSVLAAEDDEEGLILLPGQLPGLSVVGEPG